MALMKIKTISILGCGWYGMALGKKLSDEGFEVKGSSTGNEKADIMRQSGIAPFVAVFRQDKEYYDPVFFDCDLLIISLPPKRKSDEAALYPLKIARIKQLVLEFKIKRVLFISSTGVYGDHNTEVDELVLPEPDTVSGKVIFEAEALLKNETAFVSTVIRFGGLFGPGRDPGKFFAGKKNITGGKNPVNLIHLEDCIGITMAVIQQEAFGYTFNACSPEHPLKMDFYTRAAGRSGLELPQFEAGLGSWKIVNSVYTAPVLGYKFNSLM